MFSRFPQEANQALEDQREIVVTEATSEVCRRDEQLHDLRTELSLQTLHAEDVSQQQNQEHAGLHQQLTGLVQETLQQRELLEASRTAQSAAGPKIDRFWRREEELLREVRCQNKWPSKNWGSIVKESTDLESHISRTSEGQLLVRELRSEIMQLQAWPVPPDITRDLVIQDMGSGMTRQQPKTENQKAETHFLQRDQESTQDALNNLDEVNLHWTRGVYVDDSVGTSISSVSRVPEPAISLVSESIQCPKQHQNLLPAPSTPPASNSKATLAAPSSFITSTSLLTESAVPTVAVPHCGGQTTIDKWPPPTELGSWKINFKSEVNHGSQFPRDAVLWLVKKLLAISSLQRFKVCCDIDVIRQQNYRNRNQPSTRSCGVTPSCSCTERIQYWKQLQEWLHLRLHHQRESRKLQWQYTNLLFRRLLYQMRVQTLHWHPWFWRTKKKETEAILIDNWLQPTEFRSGKSASKAKFLFLGNIPSRHAMDWCGWGCQKCWRAHYFRFFHRRPNTRLRESWFQDCKRAQEDLNRKLQEKSHHSWRQSSNGEENSYRQRDCLDDLRHLQNKWATKKPPKTSDIRQQSNSRTTTVKPPTQRGAKYYQQ